MYIRKHNDCVMAANGIKNSTLAPPLRRLLSGGAWVATGRVAGIALTVAGQACLAQVLSPAEFGVFVVAWSTVSFGSLVAGLGLNQSVVRMVGLRLSESNLPAARQVVVHTALIATVSTLLVVVGYLATMHWLGASLLPLDNYPALLWLCGSLLIPLTLVRLLAECMRAFHQAAGASLLTGQTGGPVADLVFLGGLLVLSRTSHASLESALALNWLALAVAAPLGLATLWRAMSRQPLLQAERLPGAREPLAAVKIGALLALCIPLLVNQLLDFLIAQGDLWLAGSICPAESVGWYAAARRITQLVALPFYVVNMTIAASIVDLHARNQTGRLEKLLRASATLASMPAYAALLGLLLMPELVLHLLFGAAYRDAANLLVLLCLGQLFIVWTGTCGLTLLLTGHHRVTLIINLCAAAVLLPLGSAAAAAYGASGLAVAYATITTFQCLTLWAMCRRRIGVWTQAWGPWSLVNWLLRNQQRFAGSEHAPADAPPLSPLDINS